MRQNSKHSPERLETNGITLYYFLTQPCVCQHFQFLFFSNQEIGCCVPLWLPGKPEEPYIYSPNEVNPARIAQRNCLSTAQHYEREYEWANAWATKLLSPEEEEDIIRRTEQSDSPLYFGNLAGNSRAQVKNMDGLVYCTVESIRS